MINNNKWPFQLSPQEINEVLNYVDANMGERSISIIMKVSRTQVDKAIRRFKQGLLKREGSKIIYKDEPFELNDSINISDGDLKMIDRLKNSIKLGETSQAGLEYEKAALKHALLDKNLINGQIKKLQIETTHRSDDNEDMDSLWNAVSKINERIIKDHLDMPYFDTHIKDPGPISISFISDHHVAPYAPCDLRKMAEDAALIASTPGAYAVLGGDGVDNHIKHHSALISQASTPDMQWKLYDHYLQLLNVDNSILVMISGNHDDWTADLAGVDMISRLSQKHKIHYAPDEAYINLTIGSQNYVIAMRHKFRFNSSSNLGHTVKKWYDEGKMPFDVGCIGHHHEAHYEIFHKHGLDRIALRPGSYQISSPYARRNGFNPARPVAPTVILWGDRRELMAFKDVKQGVEYLTYLREKAGL